MITVVVGKEIEKIKGDFESYLNGLNMVGEISYSQYSELYDEGTKQIQRAYELGKSEFEWHDLEKNPNDLPDNSRFVWCDYGDGYGKGFYDKDDGGWWIGGNIYCSVIDAWCELPTRDKGEKEK